MAKPVSVSDEVVMKAIVNAKKNGWTNLEAAESIGMSKEAFRTRWNDLKKAAQVANKDSIVNFIASAFKDGRGRSKKDLTASLDLFGNMLNDLDS